MIREQNVLSCDFSQYLLPSPTSDELNRFVEDVVGLEGAFVNADLLEIFSDVVGCGGPAGDSGDDLCALSNGEYDTSQDSTRDMRRDRDNDEQLVNSCNSVEMLVQPAVLNPQNNSEKTPNSNSLPHAGKCSKQKEVSQHHELPATSPVKTTPSSKERNKRPCLHCGFIIQRGNRRNGPAGTGTLCNSCGAYFQKYKCLNPHTFQVRVGVEPTAGSRNRIPSMKLKAANTTDKATVDHSSTVTTPSVDEVMAKLQSVHGTLQTAVGIVEGLMKSVSFGE